MHVSCKTATHYSDLCSEFPHVVSCLVCKQLPVVTWMGLQTHTHTRGGRQPCRLVPCHPSRLAPEEFRAITQQVGLPVGVLTVGAMTVGSMGRPRPQTK